MQRPKLFNNAQDYESVDFMFDDLDWNNAKKDSDEEKDFTAAKSIMNDVFKSTIYAINTEDDGFDFDEEERFNDSIKWDKKYCTDGTDSEFSFDILQGKTEDGQIVIKFESVLISYFIG
jgi:hypothetical protein